MKMKRTIEKELEPLLLSLGYRRVVGGQGSYIGMMKREFVSLIMWRAWRIVLKKR